MSSHPLQGIPAAWRWRVFLVLLASTLLLMAVFSVSGALLTTAAAPQGIVSLELAGSVSRTESILASWTPDALLGASFGLGLDYLFMPLYSTTIALGCVWAADVLLRRRRPLASAGIPLAWGLWLAALFDALENVALLNVVLHPVAVPWPQVSFFCASIKFALIILGLIYCAYGAIVAHVRPRQSGR
jgi:hypothetical protein